jgi:hypothetical protein
MKMAAAMFAETLDCFKDSERLIPKSQNSTVVLVVYILHQLRHESPASLFL